MGIEGKGTEVSRLTTGGCGCCSLREVLQEVDQGGEMVMNVAMVGHELLLAVSIMGTLIFH